MNVASLRYVACKPLKWAGSSSSECLLTLQTAVERQLSAFPTTGSFWPTRHFRKWLGSTAMCRSQLCVGALPSRAPRRGGPLHSFRVCTNVTSSSNARNGERILVTGASSRTSAYYFNADPSQRFGDQHPTSSAETMFRRPVCQRSRCA